MKAIDNMRYSFSWRSHPLEIIASLKCGSKRATLTRTILDGKAVNSCPVLDVQAKGKKC